jgi:Fe-S oxidoreductase/nitrate reductase gamma subunit
MLKTLDIFVILLTLVLLVSGLRRRIRLWTVGRAFDSEGVNWKKIKSLLVEGVAHRRILRDKYPGFLHLFLFLGFIFPLLIIIFTQIRFSIPRFLANLLSLTLDMVAVAVIVSLGLFFFRRTITRPSRLDNRPEDLAVLLLLLAIAGSGLLMEGLRLTVAGGDIHAWAPAGHLISAFFRITGVNTTTLGLWSMIVFRVHFFLVLATIAYIPYSKMFHIFSSPLNMLFHTEHPKGILTHIDLEDEEAESFGVSKLQEFTWKQLMDLDACTRCGRCQDQCPAYLTEKPLSPKKLIQDLHDHLHAAGPEILQSAAAGKSPAESPALVKDIISEDTLWACTTCRSCMEHCPVYVEHVDKIVDMRRYQVLMESRFPEELLTAFRGLEKNSNPWGLGYDSRADWMEELNVPLMADFQGEDLDFLFYVGCIRSYDDRNKMVALALTKILNFLGVKFAILGMEEGCCGDPARRVGNEYLYQMLAQTNIETFNKYKIQRILTTCPHCFNTLKNEYPQLGYRAEVQHHTTYLLENIHNEKLKLSYPLPKKMTYHDPCYLGRYNDIFDPPRDIIRSIPSTRLIEMDRNRHSSFCCGAGGGWMWMDEKIGKRINAQRLEQALKTDPQGIATACPFCVTMFSDAVKDLELESSVKVWDIAEIVALSLFGDQ